MTDRMGDSMTMAPVASATAGLVTGRARRSCPLECCPTDQATMEGMPPAGDRPRGGIHSVPLAHLLLVAAAFLFLSACGGGRVAPVDEVGVAGTGAPVGGSVATSPAVPSSSTADGASSAVVVSVLPGEREDSGAPLGQSTGPGGNGAASVTDSPGYSTPSPATEPSRGMVAPAPGGLNPAVVALMDDAERRTQAGEHDAAAARIERALQVSPDNAWLWHRLARERLAQGRAQEAENLATRSISLAPGDARLQASNWRVMEQARRARGDERGADEAAARAARLEAETV